MTPDTVDATLHTSNTLRVVKSHETADDYEYHSSGGGGGGGMLEARVAKLETEVSYIRRDVDEMKADVKSIDRSMATVLERLDAIKESLNGKPSSDAVDKKIANLRLAILLGVPSIIAVGTGIFKTVMYLLTTK